MRKEQYTLIGGPLIGEAAPFIEEMTIRRLLRNTKPIKGWTLEVPQYAPEHTLICSPLYDSSSFDDLQTIYPHPLLFEEKLLSWSKLTVFYSLFDTSTILQWHGWIWDEKQVEFIFRQYKQGEVQKVWNFTGIECRDLSAGEDNHYDAFLECRFAGFQQTFPIYKSAF